MGETYTTIQVSSVTPYVQGGPQTIEVQLVHASYIYRLRRPAIFKNY